MSTTTTTSRPSAGSFPDAPVQGEPVQGEPVQGEPVRTSPGSPTERVAGDDPFQAIADAMEAAAREEEAKAAPKSKTRRAKAKPSPATDPAAASGLSRAIYTASYGIGFGVAFPAYFVLGLLPSDSAAARGFRDGAQAARDALGNDSK